MHDTPDQPSPTAQPLAHVLPPTGFLRLKQVIGDPKAVPPILPIIPVSRSHWYNGVRSGKYPSPVHIGPATVAWRVEDIRALVEMLGGQ